MLFTLHTTHANVSNRKHASNRIIPEPKCECLLTTHRLIHAYNKSNAIKTRCQNPAYRSRLPSLCTSLRAQVGRCANGAVKSKTALN
jgi:hypothetical protein